MFLFRGPAGARLAKSGIAGWSRYTKYVVLSEIYLAIKFNEVYCTYHQLYSHRVDSSLLLLMIIEFPAITDHY